ncbi:hypothetical protein [Helcococcus bovis]|uniref:hypothetical protein n=1 Tax=Helcococcus bovis TaxID=3153252 RepID=UPI0038B7E768
MKKRKLYCVLGVGIIFIILFSIFTLKSNLKSNLIERTGVKLPIDSKVTEVFSSRDSFLGDGNRLLKLITTSKKLEGTDLIKKENNMINHIEKDIVKRIITESKINLKLDKMQYLKTIETSEKGYTLIIMYNTEEDIYYLFENKI